MVDFSGYSKAEVLRALHDTAPPQADFYIKLGSLPLDYAAELVEMKPIIQYLRGRYLFVDFKTFPLLDPTKFDEVNGGGCMEKALDMLYKRSMYEQDQEEEEELSE